MATGWVRPALPLVASRSLASYLDIVPREPILAPSAFKQGISEEDIMSAYRNPVRIFDLDDGFTMIIGANATAIIFEVGAIEGETADVVVHAMRAREKFLR